MISIVEAQDLSGEHFRDDIKNGYGEVSTFCIVRYGDQEKRTDTQVEVFIFISSSKSNFLLVMMM